MKFTIDCQLFAKQLADLAKVIPPVSSKVIMTGVHIDASEDGLLLTGMRNDEIFMRTTIFPGELTMLKIEEPGKTVVEARMISELLNKTVASTVTVSQVDDTLLTIDSQDGQYNIVSMPADDYPNGFAGMCENHLQIPGKILKDIVSQVKYAAAEKDNRTVLQGIHLSFKPGKMEASATDAVRLAKTSFLLENQETFSLTVPVSSFTEIARLFGDMDKVDLYYDKSKLQAVSKSTIFQTHLYSGKYPNVDGIIPVSFTGKLNADYKEIVRRLEIVDMFSSKGSAPGVPIKMECSEEEVLFSVMSADIGNGRQHLVDSSYQGDPMLVCFNGKLILQALRAMPADTKTVTFEFSGELRPMRITSDANDALVAVVVPIRVS
jgi:DNA polymerase-3 subunit beta